jgi:predicted MFS family arabinose efflux permease
MLNVDLLAVQGSITSGLGSAVFASFWVTLTFLLSEEPYKYNTLVIGLFGLVGMTGVCTAPFVGKSVDRIMPWSGVVLGNLLLIVANVLLLGGAQTNVAFIIIAILILDIGQQFQQVSNQSRIFSTNPQAGARLNSVYIIG